MEYSRKRSVIVGVFVFFALVIFVIGVLTLGGQKSLFNQGARISVYFDQVNGLLSGNNVWYAGVKVGTVQDIVFDKSGKVRVDMTIEREYLPVIKKDSRAKVGSDGFIGNKLVVISGGTPSAQTVEDGSTLTAEAALGMEDMMATLQKNNENLLVITDNFKTLSNGLTQGHGTVGKLLQDDQLFDNLQQSITTIRSAAVNAQHLITNLSAYTDRLSTKGSFANDLVSDTLIFARLRNTARQIDALSLKANDVFVTLNRANEHIQQQLVGNNSTVGLLLNDKQAADDIRVTIKNLQSSTQKLDENMEALQHNFLLRGFFRKKEKDKAK